MFQMLKSTPGISSLLTFHTRPSTISGNTRSRAGRSTVLPKLPQLFPDLTSRAGPVAANAIPKLGDVASEIELVLLKPADIEFLARGAALELAGDVFLIVPDDSISRIRCQHDNTNERGS